MKLYIVDGKTFDFKDQIKNLGGTYVSSKKVWVVKEDSKKDLEKNKGLTFKTISQAKEDYFLERFHEDSYEVVDSDKELAKTSLGRELLTEYYSSDEYTNCGHLVKYVLDLEAIEKKHGVFQERKITIIDDLLATIPEEDEDFLLTYLDLYKKKNKIK